MNAESGFPWPVVTESSAMGQGVGMNSFDRKSAEHDPGVWWTTCNRTMVRSVTVGKVNRPRMG